MCRSIRLRILIPFIVLILSCFCEAKPSVSKAPSHYLEEIWNNVNDSVDPCDNFYDYACGNWKPKEIEDSIIETKSVFNEIQERIISIINSFLVGDNDTLDKVYPDQLKSLRKYYQVCTKSSTNFVTKSLYYSEVLNQIGGFPAINQSWVPEKFDWIAMASYLNAFGCENLLAEHADPKNPFVFLFGNMALGFSVPVTSTIKSPEANADVMLNILSVYGVDKEKSQIIIKEVLDFIETLTKFNIDAHDVGSSHNKSDLSYKEELMKYVNIAWNLTDENDIDEMVLHHSNQNEEQQRLLSQIIRTINEAKPEVVANFLSMKLLNHLHSLQLLGFRDKNKFCTSQVMTIHEYFIGLLYNSTISNEEQISRLEDINKLSQEIFKSFETMIKSTDWLDQRTKNEATKKLKGIRISIGQADDILGDVAMKEMLELNFNDDHYQNFLEMLKFKVKLSHFPFKLRKSLNRTTKPWGILDYAAVNAFYVARFNSISIPNGILNDPIYNKNQHSAVKYSRLGYYLGHEIFHAFDNRGRQLDSFGHEVDWWSALPDVIYDVKSRCFEIELNMIRMTFDGGIKLSVNGNKTVNEALADSIGLEIAFDAFKRNTINEEVDEWCLDHRITKEQLFFLSLSQLYCSEYTMKRLNEEAEDNHLTDFLRIMYILPRSTTFAEHFQCKKGSTMNRGKICKLF